MPFCLSIYVPSSSFHAKKVGLSCLRPAALLGLLFFAKALTRFLFFFTRFLNVILRRLGLYKYVLSFRFFLDLTISFSAEQPTSFNATAQSGRSRLSRKSGRRSVCRFHQHFCPTFLCKQDEKLFFGNQRLANIEQIWLKT